MKIGVVGCGALGTYYGARLTQGGHEVHFLLRSDYHTVRRQGVRISSWQGDCSAQPQCANRPQDIGHCELTLVTLKTTANNRLVDLVPPLVGPKTLILTLQNGLGNEAALATIFGPDNILGGLCFICVNRIAPGCIRHLAHGKIVIGEYGRPLSRRLFSLASSFDKAGIPCTAVDDLDRAHWEKLVWNIPFNGLGVASAAGLEAVISGHMACSGRTFPCLTTDRLLSIPDWFALVEELMREIISTAEALGHTIPRNFAELQIKLTREMGTYRASTLIDFEKGMPLELQSMFELPLRKAAATGVATPRLRSLVSVLRELNPTGASPAASLSEGSLPT